jgi:hypothetical protein
MFAKRTRYWQIPAGKMAKPGHIREKCSRSNRQQLIKIYNDKIIIYADKAFLCPYLFTSWTKSAMIRSDGVYGECN